MPKLAALFLPLLLLACRPPDADNPRRRGPDPASVKREVDDVKVPVRPKGPFYFDLKVPQGVDAAADLTGELAEALQASLKDLDPQPLPKPIPKGATVLRVEVERYRARPPVSPYASWLTPGIPSVALGATALASASCDTCVLPLLLGVGFTGFGLTAIILGSILGAKQARLDRERGYALHVFKVKARIEYVLDRDEQEWAQTYRQSTLAELARRMAPEESKDPARIRRELVKLLAQRLRADISLELGWYPETKRPGP